MSTLLNTGDMDALISWINTQGINKSILTRPSNSKRIVITNPTTAPVVFEEV